MVPMGVETIHHRMRICRESVCVYGMRMRMVQSYCFSQQCWRVKLSMVHTREVLPAYTFISPLLS